MRPLRLAIVRQRYNPYGGAERFVERVLQALSDRPVDLTVITRKWSGDTNHTIRLCNPLHVGRLWRDVGFARCVRRTAQRERYDLVQSHERIAGCDVYRAGDGVHAAWLARRAPTQGRLARLATRLAPWHRYTLWAERSLFMDPRLRAVICISRMVRDDILRHFPVAPDKLHVIYNGLDLEHFHPRLALEHRAAVRARMSIGSSQSVFLFVGSGFARKGVGVLLSALAAIPGSASRLIVVGRDKDEDRYRALARSLGLAQRVHFVGGQADPRPFYGAADAFVLPTLYEPLSNAVLEALACGLPVVTSTSCGAAELIVEGRSGYVCDALDVASLARHMQHLERPGVAAAMRDEARAAVARLSPEAMAERLLALYHSLLGEAREPGTTPRL